MFDYHEYIGGAVSVCPKCQRPYWYIGDMPEGGWIKGQEPYCTCGLPITPKALLQGWLCPRCNKINAPFVEQCPCTSGTSSSSITITP